MLVAVLLGVLGLMQTNTGEVAGIVRDISGAVLPGATVLARHHESGAVVERTTDESGRFFLPAMRAGPWDISAALHGFSTQTRYAVLLEIGRTITVDFRLNVEGVAEEITVAVSAARLNTTTAEISDVVDNRQLVQLPINGRTFIALAQLSNAVVLPPGGTRGDALQQAGPLPNVGGQRSGHNIYLLDGAKVTDELFNNLVISPAVDSIQEFKIQKSMYPAEFGGKASALINVATRAGGNTLRGSAFEFLRSERFDARNAFDDPNAPVPPLSQHQFGGTLGGPLVKDRASFFGSYEGLRSRRSLTRQFSVPSDAVRAGNFAGFGAICDPLTIYSSGSCTPFANNQIPTGRIDPIAAGFLDHLPRASSAAQFQNLTAVERSSRDIHQFSVRGDHRVGAGDQLFARFSTFDADELQPFGTSALQEALVPGFGRTLGTTTRNLMASYMRPIGNSKLNEFRIGWMSVEGGQASVNQGTDFAATVGLTGVTTDPRDVGFPQVSTRGLYSTFGDPTSFVFRRNRHFELYDNFTVERGAHRIKTGAYFFGLQLRPEQPDNARGSFTYTGQFTGNAFADFLLGYPTSATSGIGRGDEDGRTTWLHAYAQDDWRARDNLTFNVGLRYEFNRHMVDAGNRLSSIDLSSDGRFVIASDEAGTINADAAAMLPLIPVAYISSAAAGWDRSLLRPGPIRLAPRSGFALTLDDGRGVVRGGYGIFLNQWAYSVQTAFARNLPFFFTKQIDVPLDVTTPPYRTSDMLTSTATGTVGGNIMDHDYRVEYSQTWTGGFQYEIVPATVIDVSYMGTWTLGADNATIRNVPTPGPGAIQPRRPIPQLSRINAIRFDGKSIYHGLTLKVDRRLRNRHAYTVSYTLSSSIDDASSPGPTESEANVPQNVRNVFDETGEWARSSFDHRHQLVANGMVGLPGGVRVNGILTIQSGAPFTVNLGVDQANIGTGPAQRPNQISDPNLPGGARTWDRWFDTAAFALPAPFAFGTAPRNSVIGPGYASVDAAVAKTWAIGGSTSLEIRWEVFNLLNRANFDVPNRVFGTPNFGRIFSAKNPREMQLGARLTF